MKKLFDNPPVAIVAIVVIILLFAAYKAKATEIEVGATYTGEFNGGAAIVALERVANERIDIGFALIGQQSYKDVELANNGNVFFAFVAKKPAKMWRVLPDEVSIGATYWYKIQSPINGGQNGYMLGLKWRITEHASIGLRHWSNAGTSPPNRGQDLLTYGWRF
jgi:hypothetical protein